MRGGDGVGDACFDRDQVTIQTTNVGEHLEREPFPFDPDWIDRPNRAQQLRRTISRQSTRRATRHEFPQRRM